MGITLLDPPLQGPFKDYGVMLVERKELSGSARQKLSAITGVHATLAREALQKSGFLLSVISSPLTILASQIAVIMM